MTGAAHGGVRLPNIPTQLVGPCRIFYFGGELDGTWRPGETLPDSNTARVVTSGRGEYTRNLSAAARDGDASAQAAIALRGIRSCLIVPLRSAGRVIGTVHADAVRPNAFRAPQLELLQVLADHAGGAVERIRLYAEGEERLRGLEAAQRVSAAVNSAADLDGMLERVLAEASALVKAQRGTIALVDPDRRFVRGRVGHGLPPGLLDATVRRLYDAPHPDEDVFALVVRQGDQLIVEDDHPALHRATTVRFALYQEHRVFTPIRHAGQVIGVLTLSWTGTFRPRSEDLTLLQLIAEQAGGAIARARLAETERLQLRQLQQEQAKRAESETRFTQVFHHSAAGMALIAPDGRFLQVNAALCRTLGYGADELLATGVLALIHPGDRQASQEDIARLLSSEADHFIRERRYVRKDGSIIWVVLSVSLIHDEGGSARYFVAQYQDITGAKASEGALIEQYRKAEDARLEARAILDATEEAIILVSPGGAIVATNRRVQDLFGFAPADLEGRRIETLTDDLIRIFHNPHAEAWLRDRFRDPAPQFALDLTQHEPVERELSLYSTPVHNADGTLVSQLFAFRDITMRKRAEAERAALLAVQTALHDRDLFLSIAAHELKTPITGLRGFAQLLERHCHADAPDMSRLGRMAERITEQAGKLNRLVNQLLDFSRLETNQLALAPEQMDLAELVNGTCAAVQAQMPGRFMTVRGPSSLRLCADPLRLEQLLTNLIDNARKYSPDGAPIEIAIARQKDRALVSVRDHGPGIPVEARDRIFDRFHRITTDRHVDGIGLGLYLSRQIAELHGGALNAEFPTDGGSRFVLSLPLCKPEGNPALSEMSGKRTG